mmetsp:Transcript_31950/g.81082  ORF Transcript_31950/g.81082 Transcript_31950/m.81082 type:complete len:320 (-) Transcript_31950:395-1354(-)
MPIQVLWQPTLRRLGRGEFHERRWFVDVLGGHVRSAMLQWPEWLEPSTRLLLPVTACHARHLSGVDEHRRDADREFDQGVWRRVAPKLGGRREGMPDDLPISSALPVLAVHGRLRMLGRRRYDFNDWVPDGQRRRDDEHKQLLGEDGQGWRIYPAHLQTWSSAAAANRSPDVCCWGVGNDAQADACHEPGIIDDGGRLGAEALSAVGHDVDLRHHRPLPRCHRRRRLDEHARRRQDGFEGLHAGHRHGHQAPRGLRADARQLADTVLRLAAAPDARWHPGDASAGHGLECLGPRPAARPPFRRPSGAASARLRLSWPPA